MINNNAGNMSRHDAAIKNLVHYLNILRGLPCTVSLDLLEDVTGFQRDRECFAVCTHVDSAFENWVLDTSDQALSLTPSVVRRAIDFFDHENVPFVWPALTHEIGSVLDCAGLHRGGQIVAMNWNAELKLSRYKALTFRDVMTTAEAERWADAAWSNFGGEDVAPETFRTFAADLSQHKDINLVIADEDTSVGTFMLVSSGSELECETGVYYFATAPSARRRGVATAMMREIGRRALEASRPLVTLQATPAGLPFYNASGFVTCDTIPVYSNVLDIFD